MPYDGYPATLHKNERVLTSEEAKEYRNGGGGINIAKLADQIVVREESRHRQNRGGTYMKINSALEAGA